MAVVLLILWLAGSALIWLVLFVALFALARAVEVAGGVGVRTRLKPSVRPPPAREISPKRSPFVDRTSPQLTIHAGERTRGARCGVCAVRQMYLRMAGGIMAIKIQAVQDDRGRGSRERVASASLGEEGT